MPQVKEMVSRTYPDIPIKMFEPNTAVAKGAAIHANNLMKGKQELQKWQEILDIVNDGKSEEDVIEISDLNAEELDEETKKKITKVAEEKGQDADKIDMVLGGKFSETLKKDTPVLKNITSKSFGIEVLVTEMIDGEVTRTQKISNLVTKQDPVPVTITKEFGTAYANMVNAELIIYETDVTEPCYDIGGNEPLGTAVLDLPPNLPEGSPIEITIELSTDGLLKLRGYEKTSHNECKATMQSDAILTVEEVEEQTAALSGLELIS